MTLLFVALLSAAQAQPPAVDNVRCFIATASLIQNPDPAINLAGMMGANYFLGRIDGAATVDLEQRMTEVGPTITPVEMAALLQSCGALMKARGEAVQEIGKRLDKPKIPPPTSS